MSKNPITPHIEISFETVHYQTHVPFKKLENGQIEYEAVLQTANEINRNTKYYSSEVLSEAINTPRIVELVKRNSFFGELSHPYERKNFQRSVEVLPNEVSHRICNPRMVDNKVVSTIHTVAPRGSIVTSWVADEGSQLGHSMRGITPYTYTKISPVKHTIIKSPMSIITYDIVLYPSHPEALMVLGNSPTTEDASEDLSVFVVDSRLYTHEGNPFQSVPLVQKELVRYVSEESSAYQILQNELGIAIDPHKPITKVPNRTMLECTLQGGALARIAFEEAVLTDIRSYI
jgi:hypothetical protein